MWILDNNMLETAAVWYRHYDPGEGPIWCFQLMIDMGEHYWYVNRIVAWIRARQEEPISDFQKSYHYASSQEALMVWEYLCQDPVAFMAELVLA